MLEPDLGDGDQEQKHNESAEQYGHNARPLALAFANDFILRPRHQKTSRSATSAANKANRYSTE